MVCGRLRLESGSCRSNITRQAINQFIHRHDTSNLITKSYCSKPQLLCDPIVKSATRDPLGSNFSLGSQVPIPCTSSESDYQLADFQMFRCPHCPCYRAQFRTARDLENDMLSPAHAPKIYYCPVPLFSKSDRNAAIIRTFSTLSGLMQHLESSTCDEGYEAYRKIMRIAQKRVQALRIRDMKLLR
jgi:hypothetical protein